MKVWKLTGLCVAMYGGLGVRADAQDAAALRVRMHVAADASSLEDPALLPWHLKLAVQLYDAKGNPSEQGTIEEWWSRPDNYRVVYTFPSYTGVEARTPGDRLHSAGPGGPPALAHSVLRQVTNPFPDAAEIDAATPDDRKESFGGSPYDCIMLDRPIKNVAYPPLGLFPTYCLDHVHDLLAATFEYGDQLTTRTKGGLFQKKSVPLSLTVNVGQVRAAEAQVTSLQGRSAPYPEASEVGGLLSFAHPSSLDAGVIAGRLVSHVQPVYPQSAKNRHATGAVVMRAMIGRDGRIESLTPVQVPDPDLAIAAMAAVRQWVYKPYLLNGEPTEVDTTITVNYTMN